MPDAAPVMSAVRPLRSQLICTLYSVAPGREPAAR
jgi:hypothetical protein